MGNVRRGGIVMVATGIGGAIFFITLVWIVQERDVLSGAAAAIIRSQLGWGLLMDGNRRER
jgi:hypothetical protein